MVSKELVAASSKPLILSILAISDSYGYEIIRKVGELSDNELQWKDGMLYPILHKLEKEGCVRSYWKKSPAGRKRKYYTIEESGKTVLEEQKSQWHSVHNALNKLWGGEPCLS